MAIRDSFIGELKHESALTRKILERVPLDKKDWKPHEKSTSLGRLATHIAETHRWISTILGADEFDFATAAFKPNVASSTEELLAILDKHVNEAIEALSKATDEDFEKQWAIKRGGQTMMSPVKKVAVRGWGFSHTYHHRGQLSVYLRLLDIPVPGMYGPSADER
ncbi:MAG: DinB family protein [Chitinophagaceae bacterium]